MRGQQNTKFNNVYFQFLVQKPVTAPRSHRNYYFTSVKSPRRRFQWPRGLRRGSVAAQLPGLRHGHLPLVSVVRCQLEVSALDWSLVQESFRVLFTECHCEISIMRRLWTTSGCRGGKKSPKLSISK